MKQNTQRFMKGTLLLSIAALITKILSAVYRVPFQNIVGDVGFYIYQQIYPFYGIAITLTTYGFPVILSKVMAECMGKKHKGGFTHVYTAFISIFYFSLIVFLFLFFGSGFLARLMGDSRLVPLIQTVSFMYLLVPFISVMRGFHQGMGNMIPTAFSQIVEQTIRVVFILLTSSFLIWKGHSLYHVGIGAFLSALFASLISTLFLLVITLRSFPLFQVRNKFSFRMIFRPSIRMIVQSIAVSISGLSLILFQMGDAFQLYSQLVQSGIDEMKAKMLKGVFDRGQPLLQIGIVLITSFSLSTVPFISSSVHKNEREAKEYVRFALQMSIAFSSAATIGLIAIMDPLNTMLFENNTGTLALQLLSPTVFFASLFMTTSAVLQGYGHVYFPAGAALFGVMIKLTMNPLLITMYGINGAAIATTLSFFFVSMITLVKLKQKVDLLAVFRRRFLSTVLVSLILLGISILLLYFVFHSIEPYFASNRLFSTIQAVGIAIVGGVVFLLSFLRAGILTKDEIELLPFGDKWSKLLKNGR
ncbi:putative polysaccharide biosynthesis protein [Fervidibacillus halotolerans]|uniref:Polysaccharide biosynthesis protein n=1 Tax=Fervidibacillus halotolerans TaxID=2980027 RepID=A0A9E8S079_9BACI|nr:polysaccharide biosynthesis protein [Fervidibacillus halotolerans]WAA12347.1 polysaccharide biosynthesis protein [Fervidibacillus halotolerans]